MQQIINFIYRYKNTLLFLLLFAIAFGLTVQSHRYHTSKVIGSANFMTGGLYSWVNHWDTYFNLRTYNERLVQENKRLRSQLLNKTGEDSLTIHTYSTAFSEPYQVVAAEVISNSYAEVNNFLLLNRGEKAGVQEDFGVLSNIGIVGIIQSTSANYSRVISILNSNSAINVRLKKSNHYGTLIWNGKDPNIMQLTYVPKIANIQKGDTVITGGKSFIFPEGVPVGVIHSFQLQKNASYYDIQIQLFNDMTNLGSVYVIMNKNKQEYTSLSTQENNE